VEPCKQCRPSVQFNVIDSIALINQIGPCKRAYTDWFEEVPSMNTRANDTMSDKSLAVARQVCGASGAVTSDLERLLLSVSAAPLPGKSSIVTSSSLSRAAICGATNTLVGKGDCSL
jgi:hypothetical protein